MEYNNFLMMFGVDNFLVKSSDNREFLNIHVILLTQTEKISFKKMDIVVARN